MKFFKRVLSLLLILLLVFPYEALAAYPSGSRTNIDTGQHIKIVGASGKPGGYDWNNHLDRPTMKYSLVNPEIGGNHKDYMYEANWFTSINGQDTGKKVVLMRPRSDGGAGRTLAQPGDVSWWGTKLNGNPSYVQKMYNGGATKVINGSDGSSVNRAYTRDLGKWSGATLNIAGTGQIDDGPNGTLLEMATVQYTTTPFPDPRIAAIGTVVAGKPITINLSGREFYPHSYYGTKLEIHYEVKVDGKVVKTDTKFASTFSDTLTISEGICQSGTHKVELTATDRVERSTTISRDFTVSGSSGDCGPPTTPTDPPPGTCSTIMPGGNGGTVSQNITAPSPYGSISSDSGEFDVVQGIPTSENLRVQAQSEAYLATQLFNQKTGKVVYNIPVKQNAILKWEEETKTTDKDGKPVITKTPKTETVAKPVAYVKVERDWSYWDIGTYTIHKWNTATFNNYALPGGSVTIPANANVTASGNHSPNVGDHVFPPPCVEITLPDQTVTGTTTKPAVPPINESEGKSKAESQIGQVNVKNDSAVFNGSTIMNNSLVQKNGPTPSQVPAPSRISTQQGSLYIDNSKVNNYRTSSTGSVAYGEVININGNGGERTFPFSVNDVTVHTPVVIYAQLTDDKEHDQRTNPPARSTPPNPNTDRHALILDRPFTVTMPTTGQHRNIPGYGNKNYAKYIKSKQVQFPFDVYNEDKSTFYPANTWIDVPVSTLSKTFFLPVWVPETGYTVNYRAFAINAPNSNFGTQPEANTTIPNGSFSIPPAGSQSAAHVATDTIASDVVGRLYDFRVTDILDFQWGNVFRPEIGKLEHTGNYYWVGDKSIDGKPRGNQPPFTLPVRHGSHPSGLQNVAVKTGYQFKFDMKTKGNLFEENDAIRIVPSFYFVNKDGTNRRPVDVYYHDDANYFLKIGSDKDKTYREVKLNEPLRNVEEKQLYDTAEYLYRHPQDQYKEIVGNVSQQTFARDYLRKYSKQPQVTGPYGWQILNRNLRTLTGPDRERVPSNSMVPPADVKAREQMWYGEYSLPADVWVVEQGRDIGGYGVQHRLNKQSPIFLQDGYIIVNFNVETIANGNSANPRLQYHKGPLNNQWKMEGFKYNFTDAYGSRFELKDGDVLFYHGDQSSYDDFGARVTH